MSFVIAGAGVVGKGVAKCLVQSKTVSEILIADFDAKKAESLTKSLRSEKISSRRIDFRNVDDATKILRGADVLINCAGFGLNIAAMRAAFAAKVHYTDSGGLFHGTRKQLELDDSFREEDLTAVICMGGAPGNTNIMAKYAVDMLDTVDEIKVYDYVANRAKMKKPIEFAWHMDSMLDGLCMKPVVFKNRKFIEVPPLSGRETVSFPEPVGAVDVFYRLHSEVATFPLSFRDKGVHDVFFKGGHPSEWMQKAKFLIDLGLAKKDPIKIDDKPIIPREVLRNLYSSLPQEGIIPEYVGGVRVVVRGKSKGEDIEYVVESFGQAPKGIDLVGLDTGHPISIAACMIAEGYVKKRGVLAPEVAIDPKTYFRRMTDEGGRSPNMVVKKRII